MRNKIRESLSDKIFVGVNTVFLIIVCVIMLYPMYYIVVGSLCNAEWLMRHNGLLWYPHGANLSAYEMAFKNPMILKGYFNTIFVVVVGVFINLLLTSIGAYFLSRKNVYFKKPIMIAIVVTMFVTGGIIPFYFAVRDLGLYDSLWSLILPTAVSTYNLIIMRTSFESLPDSLEESARIDGAGHIAILFKIVLPVSKAILAVMGLYYAVQHWNSWFNALLFLSKREKYPLQLILREILIQNDMNSMISNVSNDEQAYLSETVKYAVIVIATLPILCVYPFLQKYFTKGVMVGAVKG